MFVSYVTTSNSKDFHIYEKALFRSGIPYIQKILGIAQSETQNSKVEYIYNLYNLSLLYYITISFFYFLLLQFKSKMEMVT